MLRRCDVFDLGVEDVKHFVVLDGLRGVAALVIVLFHSYKGGGGFPNGALAVDFFFILSGFVIGYSYEVRLKSDMTPKEFFYKRFARLYPMILLGAVGGIMIAVLHNFSGKGASVYPFHYLLSAGVLSLFALPYLADNQFGAGIFPFNKPLWSIFFELVVNLFYVLICNRLTTAVLILAITTCLGLVVAAGHIGGGSANDFWLGFPRVAAGFFTGLFIYRKRVWCVKIFNNVNVIILICLLLIIFSVPIIVVGFMYIPPFVLMALIVMAGSCVTVTDQVGRIFRLLGAVSYPLYATHWVSLFMLASIASHIGLSSDLSYGGVVFLHLLVAPLLSFGIMVYYERPARKYLSRLLRVGSKNSA